MLYVVDCKELSGDHPEAFVRRSGWYFATLVKGNEFLAPEKVTRADLLKLSVSGDPAQAEAGERDRMNAEGAGISDGETRRLAMDSNADYILTRAVVDAGGKRQARVFVVGKTLVRRVIVSFTLADDFTDDASVDALVKSQRANLKALVDANE